MRVVILCNSDSLALPAIQKLKEVGVLLAVGIPEKNKSYLLPGIMGSGLQEVFLLNSSQWQEQMKDWLTELHPDAVWVFTFPWKIPAALLSIPRYGFMNFHFGLLPAYRGADPIFWQMKNGETTCGITIHQMTTEIDRGPVLWREEIHAIPGETYGMNSGRLGLVTASLLDRLIARLNTTDLAGTPQDAETSEYSRHPVTTDFTIRWQAQTADDIECLVNATNPKYDGAITTLRGMEVRVLEVTPVDMKEAPIAEAGTIVHADNVYGLIVACLDKKYLRINIMHLAEGYFSGIKLYTIGIRPGERFI